MKYSRSSVSCTSHLLPMEHILLMFRPPRSRIIMRNPAESMPLWTIMDTSPGLSSFFQASVYMKENTCPL